MRNSSLPLLAGAVLVLAGCSDHSDPAGPGEGPPPTSQAVNVQDNQFVNAAVRLAQGGTVRWTWSGGNQHNVTFTGGPASATQAAGTYDRTFTAAGNYTYLCTVHGQSMSGTVTVVAPAQNTLAFAKAPR